LDDKTAKIRLLIVDDHALMRMGLHSLFATEPSIEVVGEAATATDAIREAERLQPDVDAAQTQRRCATEFEGEVTVAAD